MEYTTEELISKCESEAHDLQDSDSRAAMVLFEVAAALKQRVPVTMDDYQKKIIAMANERGWSQDMNHVQLKFAIECGEFLASVEELLLAQTEYLQRNTAVTKMELQKAFDKVMKESGDVHFMFYQILNNLKISPSQAVDYAIEQNKKKLKKTIDENGTPVLR